jgi:uncharacterized protein with von Willebrand factor type A (vWA) domain
MRVWRYSRWDGTQAEFDLDAKRTLDALSDLLMEGLSVEEALEFMRRGGFELAGLDFRVMGVEELLQELRQQAQQLLSQYNLDHATDELAERLADILAREERAQRERHGVESRALNEFLEKRHRDQASLADRIESFRDHEFLDDEAGEEFKELLAEQDRLRQLEEFLRENGKRFRGRESADYETAQQIRERLQSLQQLARDLQSGNFERLTPEQLRELLSEGGARSILVLRNLEQNLRDAGFLRDGQQGPELTPRAIRRIGAAALAAVYSALRKGRPGSHDTVAHGIATPRPDETRGWEFGDAMNLHVVRTLLNGVKRAALEGRDPMPIALREDDLAVHECDYSTQTTTVLLLDMSWSMSWAGRFPAAKRVALALDHLIRTRFPRDHFSVVGFSTRARELPIQKLPLATWDMGDPFTNLQEGLLVAERLIQEHPSPSPQILVITDGQPTAYFLGKELHVEWPMGFGGVSPHAVAETLKTVRRITARNITINTFMLDDAPELVGFVERMTEINRGRAFFTSPGQLGSFLTVDYLNHRRSRSKA